MKKLLNCLRVLPLILCGGCAGSLTEVDFGRIGSQIDRAVESCAGLESEEDKAGCILAIVGGVEYLAEELCLKLDEEEIAPCILLVRDR